MLTSLTVAPCETPLALTPVVASLPWRATTGPSFPATKKYKWYIYGFIKARNLHLCPSQPFLFFPPRVFPLRSFLEIPSRINDSFFIVGRQSTPVSESASVRAEVRYLGAQNLKQCGELVESLSPLITASQHARPPVSSLKEVDGLVVDEEVVDAAA